MIHPRIGRAFASVVLAASLAVGGPALAATADTPSPTPTAPYSEHDHLPGDADSDPTWVWTAGGAFVVLILGGFAAHRFAVRGSNRRRPG